MHDFFGLKFQDSQFLAKTDEKSHVLKLILDGTAFSMNAEVQSSIVTV